MILIKKPWSVNNDTLNVCVTWKELQQMNEGTLKEFVVELEHSSSIVTVQPWMIEATEQWLAEKKAKKIWCKFILMPFNKASTLVK